MENTLKIAKTSSQQFHSTLHRYDGCQWTKIKIYNILKKVFQKHKNFIKTLKTCFKNPKKEIFDQMPCLDLDATSHHPNVDGGCAATSVAFGL
jgi:restriction endonuclease